MYVFVKIFISVSQYLAASIFILLTQSFSDIPICFSNWSFDFPYFRSGYFRSGSFCNWCVAQYEFQIVCTLFPAKIMHSVLIGENLIPVSMSNCKGHLDLFRYRRSWNREQRGYSALVVWHNWPYCQLRLQTR